MDNERLIRELKRWLRGKVPRDIDLNEDDIAQAVVLDATRRVHDFEPLAHEAMQAYMRQTAINRILDEIRRRKGLPGLTNETIDTTDVLDLPIGPDGTQCYDAALEQLSERDRELVIARVEQNLSYEEITLLLGLSTPDAARMSVTHAIERLTEKMKELSQE